MVTDDMSQTRAESGTPGLEAPVVSQRVTDEDGHIVEVFSLSTDEATLERVLRDLFELHWDKIVFGPIIQGAAWEFQAPHAPTHVGVLDGYLTVAFGAPHFHLCIGPTQGSRHQPHSTSARPAPPLRTRRALPPPGPCGGADLMGSAALEWPW